MNQQTALEKKIVAAAEKLFARRGFHATGMRQIARAAGVSIGAIYHYFTSKDDLLLAIIKREVDDLKAFLEELVREDFPPREIIHRLVERHFHLLQTRRQVLQVVQREWFAPTDRLRGRLRQLLEEIAAFIRSLLQQGMESGQIRGCNPAVAAYAILGVIMGVTPRALERDELAHEIRDHGAEEISRLLTRWLLVEGGE